LALFQAFLAFWDFPFAAPSPSPLSSYVDVWVVFFAVWVGARERLLRLLRFCAFALCAFET
jgi:hypothetical protein